MNTVVLFLSIYQFFIISTSAEVIRQCYCKTYEKCLDRMKYESSSECFAKCQSIYPSSNFVKCMQKFSNDFDCLKNCSVKGIEGCTVRKRNMLNKRNPSVFTDSMIASFEESILNVDKSRQFKNKNAANLAQCVFECIYPGRNNCTKKMKCDIFLPEEQKYFEQYRSCAVEQKLYTKSKSIYNCMSSLLVTESPEYSRVLSDLATYRRRQ